MPPTYDDFRSVLKHVGFELVRSRKHETWQKTLTDKSILIVRVSHQHGREIPRPLFFLMLKQARLTEAEFADLLKD